MRAALIDKIESVKFVEVEEPQIQSANEVKIQVKTTGICGSELHAFHGTHPFRIPPLVSGHEFAGVIVEVGKDVQNFKVGDRVTAEPQTSCGTCWECRNGMYHLCPNKRVLGARGWSGSFGEFIVMPEETLIKLPDGMSFEVGTLIEPLAVGTHAVRTSGCGLGDKILVVGCGAIGLGIIMAAKLAGCKEIYASDAAEFNLKMAKRAGATGTMNPRMDRIEEKVAEWTQGRGVDYTFLGSFGNGPLVTDAIAVTRKQGTIMEVAVLGSPKDVDFGQFYQKEIRMQGSNVYTREDFNIVMSALASGQYCVDGYVTHVIPIEEAAAGFELLDHRTEAVVKVLLKF